MKRLLVTTVLTTLSQLSIAEVVTLPHHANQNAVVVNNQGAKFRVCYYQDKAYSLGAILQVGEYYMICHPANKFETNGALKWVRFSPNTNPGEAQ